MKTEIKTKHKTCKFTPNHSKFLQGSALVYQANETFPPITALSNLSAKTNPQFFFFFFASHILTLVRAAQKAFWISLTAGDQSGRGEEGWKNQNGERERHEGEACRMKESQTKQVEPAGCQGHPKVRAADLSRDGAGADCVKTWKWNREESGPCMILHCRHFLMEIRKLWNKKINKHAQLLNSFLHYLKMHLFSLTSPKNIAQSSPELVTFSLPPSSFICLRNPIISICVKPRAWSLKQRRANLIWVNSGALCRWIKHRFSLMLPGLIKSQIPPLSSMVTQCRSPCARGDRKDEAPAAYLQLWLRGKITAEDTQVYATWWRLPFDHVFFFDE